MHRFAFRVFVRTLALAVLFASLARAQDPGATGWRWLFDGSSTKGWVGFNAEKFPEKGWAIEQDGSLRHIAGAGGGDVVSVEQFADFEMRFDWKVAPGANSGVMYRVLDGLPAPYSSGPEYQILDDALHPDGKNPKTSAAANYALYVAEGKVLNPVGEWNEGRIVCRDGVVEHWLNKKRVVRYEWASEKFRADIAQSKFKSMEKFATAERGRIALQDHGDDVWYRNIRIREFKPNSRLPLYNGKDMSGWTHHLENGGKMEDTWSIAPEGHIVCKGRPIGYIRTEKDYKNYLLEVEWRFNPVTKEEGNSGVLCRMVGPDQVWPRSIEAQLMSKNAGDFWNIGDFPMKADSTRTNGRNTRKLAMAENPVGEWNTYEIELCGGFCELKVNGQVLNDAYDCWETAGKICLQSEGAEIQFKTIRITTIEEPGAACPRLSDAPILPKWRSGRMGAADLSKFDVDTKGASELWLVVDAWENGNECDWADWAEVSFIDKDGREKKISDLDWIHATTGWGTVGRNANAGGQTLRIGGKSVQWGIGTHAPSLIGYKLDGIQRVTGFVGIDEGGATQDPKKPSVEFSIYTSRPNKTITYK